MEVYYLPSHSAGTVESTSSLEYGITYTGIEGLTVGYAGGDNETTATNTIESTNFWAKYVYDSFTIGVQRNETDRQAANTDSDFDAYGISYAVNDELSVSYGISTVDHENAALEDQDASAVSFSYVSGGMTLAGTMSAVDNVAGAAATDNEGYELNITFAF